MPHVFQIPPMNPLKFVPLDPTGNPLYNFKHDDAYWFQESILYWERKVNYNQQWQLNDLISLQFHASSCFPRLFLIDCNYKYTNEPLEEFDLQNLVTLPGNTYNGETLTTYQFQFVPEDFGITEGKYWLLLRLEYDDEVVHSYISEPLKFKAAWINTMLIQYSHNRNEYDTVFGLNPRFSFRVEAQLESYLPVYDDVAFEDQQRNKKLLNSEKNNQYDFVVGPKNGVPTEWIPKHLSEAFRCSRVLIDGKLFARDGNAQWEMERREPTPLCTATVVVFEQDKHRNFTFGDSLLVLYTSPKTYPYYVDAITISDGTTPFDLYDVRKVESVGDQSTFVTQLNLAAAGAALAGSITYDPVTGNVYYQNGPDENYTTSTGLARAKRMVFTVSTGIGGSFSYNVIGSHGRVFGDGNANTFYYTGPGPELTAKAYTSGGTYTFEIYHNDDVSYFSTVGVVGQARFTAAGSPVPATISTYSIIQHLLTSYDLENLEPAEATLQVFSVARNQIDSLTGDPWDVSGGPPTFPNISTIDVSSNEISSTDIDDLFVHIWNDAAYANYALIDTSGQSPAAPPTGASSTARADLAAAGVTIITD